MARGRGTMAASGVSGGLAVVIALLVTGCGSLQSALDNTATPEASSAAPASAAGAIGPVAGPGPQSTYPVQAQPAPGTCHYVVINAAAGQYLPDPHCTPGATNPRVTQADLASAFTAVMATNGEVTVADVRSPYSEVGEQDAREAVVFVHGNPGPATDWSLDTVARSPATSAPRIRLGGQPCLS
jgi:hypothetical protein